MTNSADQNQLASENSNWSGSTLFAKTGHVVFSKRKVKRLSLKWKLHKQTGYRELIIFFAIELHSKSTLLAVNSAFQGMVGLPNFVLIYRPLAQAFSARFLAVTIKISICDICILLPFNRYISKIEILNFHHFLVLANTEIFITLKRSWCYSETFVSFKSD